jgi:hypothetical protein
MSEQDEKEMPHMVISGSEWAVKIDRIRQEVGEEATRTTDAAQAHTEAHHEAAARSFVEPELHVRPNVDEADRPAA